MNFYTYFFLKQLKINNDLTVEIPKDNLKQLTNLSLLNGNNAQQVFKNVNNEEKCLKSYQESNINVYGLNYLTLEYNIFKLQTNNDIINVIITFMDNYNNEVVDTIDLEKLYDNRGSNDRLKFNPTALGSDKVSATFTVPDNADTMNIEVQGTDDLLFSNLFVYNGIPVVQKDIMPTLTISRMGKHFYDNELNTLDITFSVPKATDFINNVRSLNIYNLNRGLFYLIQLTCLELISLSYYYHNDKTKFNLLIPSDFTRIQTNLNTIKNRIVNYDGGKFLLNDLDDLLNGLGYMETAFTTSTNNLNLREH